MKKTAACLPKNLLRETFGKSFIKKPFFLTEKSLGKNGNCFAIAKPFAQKAQKHWEKQFASQKALGKGFAKVAINKLYMPQKSRIKRGKEAEKNCYKSYLNGKRVMDTGFNYSEPRRRLS